MTISKSEYPFALYHERGCRSVAVFMRHRPLVGEVVRADGMRGIGGEKLHKGDHAICGSCKAQITFEDLSPSFVRERL